MPSATIRQPQGSRPRIQLAGVTSVRAASAKRLDGRLVATTAAIEHTTGPDGPITGMSSSQLSAPRAAKIDPSDRLALNQLVMAYRQLGRAAEAATAASQLKALLDRERSEEVARNRMRLVRGTDPGAPPR